MPSSDERTSAAATTHQFGQGIPPAGGWKRHMTERCEKCGGPKPGDLLTCSLEGCPHADARYREALAERDRLRAELESLQNDVKLWARETYDETMGRRMLERVDPVA